MGAWGEGPFDNDTAADWAYNLEEIGLFDLIEDGLNSDNINEMRAAAWLVQKLAVSAFVYDVNKIDPHIDLAKSKLNSLLKNKDYINAWKNKKAIQRRIREQVRELEHLR